MPEPILSVEGVSKTFVVKPAFGAAREIRALRDVSLSLRRGRALALVGESGSGKSTVARLVLRQFAPTAGRILLEGQDIAERRGRATRAHRRLAQMVFQDPFSSLNPAHTVRHHLTRPLRLHRSAGDTDALLAELLRTVELDPETTPGKYPHELSGGERQRVNFARALAVDARLVVADEPTSMLDVSIRRSVLALMRRLKEERALALLYITHDIATALELAEETAVMFAGQIVETGPTEAVVRRPTHPYTRLLLAAVPDPAVRLTGSEDLFAAETARVREASGGDVVGWDDVSPGHRVARHADA